MNKKQPKAQAIAIQKNKIMKVGTNTQIETYIQKNTKTIDLKGKCVIPGLTDAHIHIAGFGRSLVTVDLRNVKSIKEIQQRIQQGAQKTPKGKWVLGRGWDQEKLIEKRYPTRHDLDQATPNHPVLITRVCGHLAVVNTKALENAGITKKTKPPKGGKIEKNPKTGEPTGILRENAMDLIWKTMPEFSEEELREACLLACQKAVESGLTSVHWIIRSPKEIRVIQELRKQNKLPLRVYVLIPVKYLDQLIQLGLRTGFGDEKVRIGSIKILVDGSLGARTAALHQPYQDKPSTKGVLLYGERELNDLVMKANKAGFQLAIHAIGDRAVDLTLDALEKALEKSPRKNHRHRIEHASVLNEKLIQRMKRLGVIASVQPSFVVSDFWVVNRVGTQRGRWVYAFKSLVKNGVLVCAGSDCPVESVNPLLGVCAAVARESFPEERVGAEEALRWYTVNAAFASFEENVKGSIEEGKLADFVVLSGDPCGVAAEKIGEIRVEMTVVDGQVVYCR
ncbi:MAG: amidohydrolase [Thermoproteota archaeon]|nr:amidohydrolase [Thermoproteota archaeon]